MFSCAVLWFKTNTVIHTYIYIYIYTRTQSLPVSVFWSGAHWAPAVWQGSVTHMLSVYIVLRGLLWSGLTQSQHTNTLFFSFFSPPHHIASLQNTYSAVALRLHFLQASKILILLKNYVLRLFRLHTHRDNHAFGNELVIRPWCAVLLSCPVNLCFPQSRLLSPSASQLSVCCVSIVGG